MTRREILCLVLTALLIAATGIASLHIPQAEPYRRPAHVRALLAIAPIADTSRVLVTGYHYELLRRYARDHGQTIDIRLAESGPASLDSLRSGAADLAVIPAGDGADADSLLVSLPVDSLSIWLMRPDEQAWMQELDAWIDRWHHAEGADSVRAAFLQRTSPFRGGQRAQISPYDSLIRAHADSLGWDWHLLAAVIWQESGFHIEARSPRGAAGLMQMMPRTAAVYGVNDTLDPEVNIAAGARLLGNLIQRYYRVGDNMTERYKYALAAYNAGNGRIDDCLRVAQLLGVDTGYWLNVVNQVLPRMREETTLATGVVKTGPFRGEETVAYVDRVIAVYERFCRICP